MFTTTDDKVLFVDTATAQSIEDMRVQPYEPVKLTLLRRMPRKQWSVERIYGEQKNGTYVLPAVPPRPMGVAERSAAPGLEEEAIELVDVLASVLRKTQARYGNQVAPDVVRECLAAVYRGRQGAA